MKLKLTQLFIFLFIFSNAFCQEVLDTDKSKENNIYIESLRKYCDSLSYNVKEKIYVDFNYQIMDYTWPKKINETEIQYLENSKDYKHAIKEKGESIILVRILPLQYKREKFFVSIIPFMATYRKRKIELVNGGGYAYEYEFDTEKKGFIYKKSSSFGL